MWCFCGEVVVECVANVVEKLALLWTANVGHVFQLYFGSAFICGACGKDRLPALLYRAWDWRC
jgi:hypothetical protein